MADSSFVLAARCALHIIPWLVQLSLANTILSLLLPISLLFPDACYDISSQIAATIWQGVQRIFTYTNGAEIVVSGAEQVPAGESALVICNHVEWTDFYMIQELALRKGMLGRCRWFAKQQLKWVPFLGWGLWAMGMPLVSRNWTADQKEMARVFWGPVNRHWPIWLVSYSEATRYTPTKRQEAEVWCKANGKALGKHVLYPRTKGFITCVQKLRAAPHVKSVLDLTIAYAQNGKMFQVPPSFVQTVLQPRLSERWRFYVHVERFELGQLPETDAGLAAWLEQRWVVKGERLELLRQRLVKGLPWDRMDV